MMRIVLAVVLVGSLGGCIFADDDDDDCRYYGYEDQGAPIAAYELRDPVTGVCQAYGGYGDCADPCSPCALSGAAEQAVPDWGQCYSQCESLDETTCRSTSACRAVYAGTAFHQCWAVAMSGPIQGSCSGLDAYACSQHDDCVAVHAGTSGAIGTFQSCAAEGTVQDPGSCVGAITCAEAEPACPGGTIAGRRNGCWTHYCIPYAQCDTLPACTALDEPGCIDRTDCSPIYEGQNCTCSGQSCSCQSWVFESCKAM